MNQIFKIMAIIANGLLIIDLSYTLWEKHQARKAAKSVTSTEEETM